MPSRWMRSSGRAPARDSLSPTGAHYPISCLRCAAGLPQQPQAQKDSSQQRHYSSTTTPMGGAAAGWLVVTPVGLHHASIAVCVSRTHPITQAVVGTVFIAAFGHDIEDTVGSKKLLAAAAKCCIGQVDLAGRIFEKDAIA